MTSGWPVNEPSFFLMNERIYKQLARCMKSLDDLYEAAGFITLLLNTNNGTVKKAAEIALIISYTRPFSGNQESIKGVPDGLPKKVFSTLNSEEFEFHTKIVKEYRNKLVAHSELSHIKPEIRVSHNGALVAMQHKHTNNLLDNKSLYLFSKVIEKVRLETIKHSAVLQESLSDGDYKLDHT